MFRLTITIKGESMSKDFNTQEQAEQKLYEIRQHGFAVYNPIIKEI